MSLFLSWASLENDHSLHPESHPMEIDPLPRRLRMWFCNY